MKNEYGVVLDRNGYAPSVFGEMERCAVCGRTDRALQRHEPFHGSNRNKSKNFGCWLLICDLCHAKLHQRDAGLDLKLKRAVQEKAMESYGWSVEDFRKVFGKSWI